MKTIPSTPVGFIGLGNMGEAMALNLARAETPLLVWNRTRSKCGILAEAGPAVAEHPAQVFARCDVGILMLVDGAAMDAVLARGDRGFDARVKGRTVINMTTTAPGYSRALEAVVCAPRAAATSRRRYLALANPPRPDSSSRCSRASRRM